MRGSCPHPYGLKADGKCYHCLKLAACNGKRSTLSAEALAFVGFVSEPTPDTPVGSAWVPAGPLEYIDKQLEELARLRDVMPGWFELARRILEDEKDKS